MKLTPMESIEPGNPFLSDAFRMGTFLGKNVCAMYEKFENQEQPYIVIVDTTTGERVRVEFKEETK